MFIQIDEYSINFDEVKAFKKEGEFTRIFIDLEPGIDSIITTMPYELIQSKISTAKKTENSSMEAANKYLNQLAKYQTVQVP